MAAEKNASWVELDALELWADNPNQGDLGSMLTSFNKFGYNDVVKVWHDRVQGGNHRKMALHQLWQGGWQPGDRDRAAKVNDAGNLEIIMLDVSHLETEQEANAFGLALNRITRLGLDDDRMLAALLQDISAVDDDLLLASGYDDDELDSLLTGFQFPDNSQWDDALTNVPDGEKSPFQQITFTVHDTQADIIRQALTLAKKVSDFKGAPNENSNGNGLHSICESFVTTHG